MSSDHKVASGAIGVLPRTIHALKADVKVFEIMRRKLDAPDRAQLHKARVEHFSPTRGSTPAR